MPLQVCPPGCLESKRQETPPAGKDAYTPEPLHAPDGICNVTAALETSFLKKLNKVNVRPSDPAPRNQPNGSRCGYPAANVTEHGRTRVRLPQSPGPTVNCGSKILNGKFRNKQFRSFKSHTVPHSAMASVPACSLLPEPESPLCPAPRAVYTPRSAVP